MPKAQQGRAKFITDAMLGSLARKLRVLGFDTAYYKSGDDAGIIRLAVGGDRVILTADRQLAASASKRGAKAVLLIARNDASRLRALVQVAPRLGLELRRGEPLCSVCNGDLRRVKKSEVAGRLHTSVASRHRLFYVCGSCGKVYWKGGHWKKLRSFERLLREG